MLRSLVVVCGVAIGLASLPAAADSVMPAMTDEARAAAQDIANDSLSRARDFRDHESVKSMAVPRPFSGIADTRVSKDREKVLKYLGINQSNDYNLYVFASLDMPEEMLQSYLRDAMWTGAIVVLRGIPDDMTLGQFTQKYASKWVGRKGATAAIQIDPRLFDAFSVRQVPVIVYSLIPSQELCQQGFNDKKPCEPANESDYWKVSGAVSLRWALEEFQKANAPYVDQPLAALKRVAPNQTGKAVPKVVRDWDAVDNPTQQMEVMARLKQLGTVYQTPQGLAVGPPGLDDTKSGIESIQSSTKE